MVHGSGGNAKPVWGQKGWGVKSGFKPGPSGRPKGIQAETTPNQIPSVKDNRKEADGHGGKHFAISKKVSNSQMTKRDFIQYTRNQPAQFYPMTRSEYNELLSDVVDAINNHPSTTDFADVRKSIGADRGEETTIVQLYGDSSIGSHIRPKTLDRSFLDSDIAKLPDPKTE